VAILPQRQNSHFLYRLNIQSDFINHKHNWQHCDHALFRSYETLNAYWVIIPTLDALLRNSFRLVEKFVDKLATLSLWGIQSEKTKK